MDVSNFDAERLGKSCDFVLGIGIKCITAILKHKRNRKLDLFNVRSMFMLLMNTKSDIFTRSFATRKKYRFLVFIR